MQPSTCLLNTNNYRILGIDPGTTKMGLCLLEVDEKEVPKLEWTETIHGLAFEKKYADIALKHNNRVARIYGYEQFLQRFLRLWDIHAIACEANYFGGSVSAYGTLTEVVYMLRRMAITHSLDFTTIAPSIVKKMVGVKGNSNDKEDMRHAVNRLALGSTHRSSLAALDHNGVDAVAIAYCRYLQYQQN